MSVTRYADEETLRYISELENKIAVILNAEDCAVRLTVDSDGRPNGSEPECRSLRSRIADLEETFRRADDGLRVVQKQLRDLDWQPIATAPCDDAFAVVWWREGYASVENLDHDSDPAWWAEHGATHWKRLDGP